MAHPLAAQGAVIDNSYTPTVTYSITNAPAATYYNAASINS
jgi:hypothetical protein